MAVLGDGAYMFSNPAAVHHAAALHELPVLFVVMNNNMWGAVERSTLAMYPDGRAAKSNEPTFIQLGKLPAFEADLQSGRRLWRTRGRSGVAAGCFGTRDVGCEDRKASGIVECHLWTRWNGLSAPPSHRITFNSGR